LLGSYFCIHAFIVIFLRFKKGVPHLVLGGGFFFGKNIFVKTFGNTDIRLYVCVLKLLIMDNLILKEKALKSQLESIQQLRENQKHLDGLQKNYDEWASRDSLWLLGKAYCAPNYRKYDERNPLSPLGIRISVPGNCSHTYEVSKQVPQAVVTYFHNVFTNEQRENLQKRLNDVVEQALNDFLNNPKCVLDMLGLQSDSYYLKREECYPPELIKDIEREIEEERFKVIDRFKEKELLGISESLSHSRSILFIYAKSRGLKKLIAEFQSKYHWAKD